MVQHNDIDHTGITGVSTISYASNANGVSSVSAGGAATAVSRGDHVHDGVVSISHTSNTFDGPITFTASGSLGITSPSAGTLNFSAVDTTGGGEGSSTTELLAVTNYAPTSQTVLSTSSTSMVDVDATNLAVTFTAPASGNVLVRLSAFGDMNGAVGNAWWGLRESTTNLTGIARVMRLADAESYHSVSIYLTGVTAGSHTYKWSYGVAGGTETTRIIVQDGSAIGEWGPGIMEVWSAP